MLFPASDLTGTEADEGRSEFKVTGGNVPITAKNESVIGKTSSDDVDDK